GRKHRRSATVLTGDGRASVAWTRAGPGIACPQAGFPGVGLQATYLYRHATVQPLANSSVFRRTGDGVGPPDRGNRRSQLGGQRMSYMKVSGTVAATVTALILSAGAYGDTGKSPNGAPGPAGNPNQPAATPQSNAPQGPQGN